MAQDKHNTGGSPFSFKTHDAGVPGQRQTDGQAPVQERTTALGQEETAQQKEYDKRRQAKARAREGTELFAAPEAQGDNPGEAYGYRKSVLGRRNEVSVYMDQMDAKHAMDRRSKILAVSGVLTVILVFLLTILPTGLFGAGKAAVSPAFIIEAIGDNVTGFANWVTGGPVTSGISVVFMQMLAAAIVGAALALNGCIFQGALKNALAAPSTLGVMSGGTLGTLIYTLLFGVPASVGLVETYRASELQSELDAMDIPSYIFATQGRALFSMAGCFIIVALVLLIAHIAGRGRVSKIALLIAGQVFAALITGIIAVIRSYIMFYGTVEQQEAISLIMGGSITAISSFVDILAFGIPILIGTVIIMILRFRLNVLAFNDEEAKSMGISTAFTRNFVIIVCTVLTGVVVSFVGSVGFVGFLVPHLARKVIGPDFRYLVPASMLFGAMYLMLANYLMNLTSIFSGSLGTLTSIIGAVFFLVVAVRERKRNNVDWI